MQSQEAIAVALEHHRAGRLAQAEIVYRQVLREDPQNATAIHLLGVVAHQAGQHQAAAELIGRAIALCPDAFEFHNNLGSVWQALGRANDAATCYRKAIALNPNYPEAYNNLGALLEQGGGAEETLALFQRAVQLKPEYADAHNNLGAALGKRKRHQEAAASCRRAIELKSDHAEAYGNLGTALQAMGRLTEAVACYRRAVELKPSHADAHNNLGSAVGLLGQYELAAHHCAQAIRLKSEFPSAYYNLAVAHKAMGRLNDAIEAGRKAVALKSDYAAAHWNLALSLLLSGDYAEGWAEYEWRWKASECGLAPRHTDRPRWDGGGLGGRTIVIYAEQGLGDTIQFARYIPMVAGRGGRVIFECQAELIRLMSELPGACKVIAKDEDPGNLDVQCPLLSLPLILGSTVQSIPCEVPYLRAEESLVCKWKQKISGRAKYKVGLAWAGSPTHRTDRERSISLQILAPLAEAGDILFYSLQKGPGAEQAVTPPGSMQMVDCSGDLSDFAETAAAIANLDLIISVDTAVAHLAGAMGKAVWTLVPFEADWRWLMSRPDDTPWYPTMRLFRQNKRGDWASVIGRVAQELHAALMR